jgi:hypothetical protein
VFEAWTKSEAFRAAHGRAGDNKPLYLDHPQFEGSRFARRWDAAKRRETRVVRKTLFRATSTHIGVLVTDFDFGGDPAPGLVRIRMVPPFG